MYLAVPTPTSKNCEDILFWSVLKNLVYPGIKIRKGHPKHSALDQGNLRNSEKRNGKGRAMVMQNEYLLMFYSRVNYLVIRHIVKETANQIWSCHARFYQRIITMRNSEYSRARRYYLFSVYLGNPSNFMVGKFSVLDRRRCRKIVK